MKYNNYLYKLPHSQSRVGWGVVDYFVSIEVIWDGQSKIFIHDKSIRNTKCLTKNYNDLVIKKKKLTDRLQVLSIGNAIFVMIQPVKNIINNNLENP